MLVEPGLGGQPRISPDGKRIVASQAGSEIYLVDVGRDVSTRFTFNKGVNMFPAWSPDGHRVYYASAAAGSFDLYWKSADMSGPEELLLRSEISKYPTDVSPDGRFLMFSQLSPKTGIDLFLLPLTDAGGDRKPVAFLQTPAAEQSGVFSPDGKWVAYTSDESGRSEIYLRPFSPPGTDRSQAGQRQVSKGGGQFARWRGDSRELYYFSGENKIAAVTIETSPTVQIGVPRPLFGAFLSIAQRFAVTADGQRFLMAAPVGEAHGAPATVVVNWTKALKP
jgi:Tol biopolymer transport system component